MRGNDFQTFFSVTEAILELVDRIGRQIDTFGQFGTRDLAILGIKKNRFLDFLEVFFGLFRKCLGIVCALKKPTFGYILTSKG